MENVKGRNLMVDLFCSGQKAKKPLDAHIHSYVLVMKEGEGVSQRIEAGHSWRYKYLQGHGIQFRVSLVGK